MDGNKEKRDKHVEPGRMSKREQAEQERAVRDALDPVWKAAVNVHMDASIHGFYLDISKECIPLVHRGITRIPALSSLSH